MPGYTTKPAIEPRVAAAVELIEEGLRPTVIAQTIANRYGVTLRQGFRDLRKAKDWLADKVLADVPAIRRQLLETYTEMMEQAKAVRDRRLVLECADRLAKLTGANEPDKLAVSGTSGVLVVGGTAASAEEWAKKYGGQEES
jgi:hypothetical protein